jgi:hypothetical protein
MSLYATPTRKKLLAAIRAHDGRVYFEAGDVWDYVHRGGKVTARMKEAIEVGWVRVATGGERPREALSGRTYYVLTPLGERVLRINR